jgi:hypothetical protein
VELVCSEYQCIDTFPLSYQDIILGEGSYGVVRLGYLNKVVPIAVKKLKNRKVKEDVSLIHSASLRSISRFPM